MNKWRIAGAAVLAIIVGGACGQIPAGAAAPSAATAPAPFPELARKAFERMQTVINAAQSIEYTSTIKTFEPGPDQKSLVPVTLHVNTKVQQPDGFRVEIDKAGSPEYVMTSGSTSGYVVDFAGKRYAKFEKPDSITGFQIGAQNASRGMLDDASGAVFILLTPVNDPRQFDVSAGAPPGIFKTVAQDAVYNGKHMTKIVQSATMEPGHGMTFRMYVDPTVGLPAHIELQETTNGKSIVGYQEDISNWTLGTTPLDASAFDYTPDASYTAYVAPPNPQLTPLLANGKLAPDFTATTPDGKPVKLSDYAGKVVVLDFWATWCHPCQMELPIESRLSDEYAPKGVVFLAVCSWDENAQFADWMKAHASWSNMTFAFDPAGTAGDQSIATKLYDVSGFPAQFIIGKDGHVFASVNYYDPSDRHQRRLIDAALAQ